MSGTEGLLDLGQEIVKRVNGSEQIRWLKLKYWRKIMLQEMTVERVDEVERRKHYWLRSQEPGSGCEKITFLFVGKSDNELEAKIFKR